MCKYCQEDKDGYVTSLDKNGHVCIHKSYICINWYGHKAELPINYCPVCGGLIDGEHPKYSRFIKEIRDDKELSRYLAAIETLLEYD